MVDWGVDDDAAMQDVHFFHSAQEIQYWLNQAAYWRERAEHAERALRFALNQPIRSSDK